MTSNLIRQKALRDCCIHPSEAFVEFTDQEALGSLVQRFERQVHMYPDRLALKTRAHSYTYSELNAAANRVAHALIEHRGVGTETVGLLFENGAPFVVASLAALKAGKIQVPLDSTFPRARLSYMLEQSESTIVVTDDANLSLAQELAAAGPLINIEKLGNHFSTDQVGLVFSQDTLASVEYTSGSTGQPKGIVRNHRGVLHTVMHHTNTFRIGINDGLTTFRASLTGSLYPLLNGATCYPINFHHEGPLGLADWLVQEAITIYRGAVSTFRTLAGALTGREEFASLRLIILFGEPVYPTEVELYRKHFPDQCVLATSLGCSEFGDYAYFLVDKDTPLISGVLPGGFANEDREILLLDEAGSSVGVDQIGEIALRSSFGAVGYWRRPDLTEAAFLPDPSGGDKRIYRTGDLGRRTSDGCLYHLGRKDFQVKIRGYRVEVAEVETALLALDGVKEAVVVGREDTPGDKRLVAYLVASGQQVPVVSELRRALAEKLPDYMVPAIFVTLERLPLTPTGKVDRRSLPPPQGTRPVLANPYAPPTSPLEETLAKVWGDVLTLEQVGIHDHFLELGGNSLLATILVSRVLRDLHVQVPLRTLFDAPTVAQMATAIIETLAKGVGKEKLDRLFEEVLSEENLPSSLNTRSSRDEA
jgi:amino acid adenylation domain-containing protein